MKPRIAFYTYGWNIISGNFDYRNALDNYALYADQIVVAINTSADGSYEAVESYVKERGYPVKMIATSFDPVSDPFFYGKVVNAALQGCEGDFFVARDLDERWCGSKEKLYILAEQLKNSGAKAYFIPTIDLYGDLNHFITINRKWYGHLPGLFRGPVNFGVKESGRPCYEVTSTDELIDIDGNLVPTISLLNDLTIEGLRAYAAEGLPFSTHLGFVDLRDRAERAKWWGEFWMRATGGDSNNHITDINELLKRETKLHGLPLWEPRLQ